MLIPKASKDPHLLPFVLQATLAGRAKDALRVANERARAEGKPMLHMPARIMGRKVAAVSKGR